jgi:type II secretory pathway pseudopilin PulG
MIAATDSAAELRSMQGYIGMGLGALPMEPKEKQSVMRAFSFLIANAGLGYEVMQQRGDTLVSEGQSLLGGSSTSIGAIAIIAAIAIPNLLESRVTANEAAAATTLKASVFPAQVQFQGGGYRDLDKDNVGEYGFFHELSGGPVAGRTDDSNLRLMTGEPWKSALPVVNGYHFAIFLPDGNGGALAFDDELPEKVTEVANASERAFVAYAWPVSASTGRRVFAITQVGVVYATTTRGLKGEEPAWNSLFGGDDKGWPDAPVWQPYKR